MQYNYTEVSGAPLPVEEINRRGKQGMRCIVATPFEPSMKHWYYLFEEKHHIEAEIDDKEEVVTNLKFPTKGRL